MPTDYRLIQPVLACDLFDGRLEEFGVREYFSDATTDQERLLTDGQSYLWIHFDEAGFIDCLTRYRQDGVPIKILSAIAEAFDTEIVSEYEPQFWGFDTQEEWHAWELEIHNEFEKEFYDDLGRYLRGEPNDIRPRTIGMSYVEIAKRLVEKDPTLLLAANKHKLRAEVEAIYNDDQGLYWC